MSHNYEERIDGRPYQGIDKNKGPPKMGSKEGVNPYIVRAPYKIMFQEEYSKNSEQVTMEELVVGLFCWKENEVSLLGLRN